MTSPITTVATRHGCRNSGGRAGREPTGSAGGWRRSAGGLQQWPFLDESFHHAANLFDFSDQIAAQIDDVRVDAQQPKLEYLK